MQDFEKVKTIRRQIGFWTLAGVGAKDFVGDVQGKDFDAALSFRLGRRAKKVRVVLTFNDLYTVELWNCSRPTAKNGWKCTPSLIKSEEGIYCCQLSDSVLRIAS